MKHQAEAARRQTLLARLLHDRNSPLAGVSPSDSLWALLSAAAAPLSMVVGACEEKKFMPATGPAMENAPRARLCPLHTTIRVLHTPT
jgi:hypothetical protein